MNKFLDTKNVEAERLANELDHCTILSDPDLEIKAAAELRRLVAVNDSLEKEIIRLEHKLLQNELEKAQKQ